MKRILKQFGSKKILYALANKVWKNDITVIQSSSLDTLLKTLINVLPSINSLISESCQLIESLNRKEVYASVARDFLDMVIVICNTTPEEARESLMETILEEQSIKENQ